MLEALPLAPSAEYDLWRTDPRVLEFQRRLAYLKNHYEVMQAHERATGTFNESLQRFRSALSSGSDKERRRARLHPLLEIVIKDRWTRRQRDDPALAGRAPTCQEMLEICQVLRRELKAFRGRPANGLLRHHVHGLMALIHDTCGCRVEASNTKDSVYDPHVSSRGGEALLHFFRHVDPTVTVTSLVNIVLEAHQTRVLEGKRFTDLFPFYGGSIDPETGYPVPGPGYRLDSFEPAYRIYSS